MTNALLNKLACGLVALGVVAGCGTEQRNSIETGAGPPAVEGGLAPSVDDDPVASPLADTALPDVSQRYVVRDGITLQAWSSSARPDEGICVRFRTEDGVAGGSMCGDPRVMDDVVVGGFAFGDDAEASQQHHYGITRGSVVELIATTTSGGEYRIEVAHHADFPAIGFFYFRDIGSLESLVGIDTEGRMVAAASAQTLRYTTMR